ncbi:MAG: hypothetical protein ACR2MK_11825, partial [Solirubrobacteraceae bacterium]
MREDAASQDPDGRPPPMPAPSAPVRQREAAADLGTSSFPPIAEYAFLSDCETVALVAPSGAI